MPNKIMANKTFIETFLESGKQASLPTKKILYEKKKKFRVTDKSVKYLLNVYNAFTTRAGIIFIRNTCVCCNEYKRKAVSVELHST